MRYRDLSEVPRRLPKAGVLVHNWVHAQWEDQRPGRNGFRVRAQLGIQARESSE